MLSEQTKEAILQLQTLYPEKRSALIPALHLAQNEVGYLPREIQDEVAHLFGIDPNDVNGVVTFYDMFFEKPVGKHLIHICKNLPCMLRGADILLNDFCQKLKIAPGETTTDQEFTVIPSECLAACDRAPMLLMDDQVIGPVKLEDIDKILIEAKNSPGHPSPVETTEVSHA